MTEQRMLLLLAPVIIGLCVLASCTQPEIQEAEKAVEDGLEIAADIQKSDPL